MEKTIERSFDGYSFTLTISNINHKNFLPMPEGFKSFVAFIRSEGNQKFGVDGRISDELLSDDLAFKNWIDTFSEDLKKQYIIALIGK